MGNLCGGLTVSADPDTAERGSIPFETPESKAREQRAATKLQTWVRAIQAIRYMQRGGYVQER